MRGVGLEEAKADADGNDSEEAGGIAIAGGGMGGRVRAGFGSAHSLRSLNREESPDTTGQGSLRKRGRVVSKRRDG